MKRMKFFRLLMTLLILFFWTQGAFADRYVDDDYCDGCPNDGYTWGTDAFATIQAAIDAATAGETVYVAGGTYYENITLANGVSLSGDPAEGGTIIDVDSIGGHVVEANNIDDTTLFENFTLLNGESRVSAAEGTGMNIVDSSLTVRNCIFENNADSALMNNNSSPTIVDCIFRNNVTIGVRNRNNSTPVFENCTFEENGTVGMENRDSTVELTNCIFRANVQNHASSQGGGMYNRESSVRVADCLFQDNLIDDEFGEIISWGGGGIYNVNGSLEVVRCEFTRNGGDAGGAIQNIGASPLTITDSVFTDNLGEYDGSDGLGGAIYCASNAAATITNSIFTGNTNYYGGAIYVSLSNGPATITNCIFDGNSATAHGGAIESQFAGRLEIVNCVFYNNLADSNSDGTGVGGALYNDRGDIEIVNSIVWNNNGSEIESNVSVTVQYSDITGGYGVPSDENIDIDPLFADAAAGNFRLQHGSDCIDTGTSSSSTVTLPATDIEGTARPLGLSHDMGVYESVSGPDITASPANLDFGDVYIGTTQSLDLTITNSGGQDLEITAIDLSDATHYTVTHPGLPVTLVPGDAMSVTAEFTPAAAGPADADLTVTSNDPDENPLGISLTGMGRTLTHTITASAGAGGRIDPEGTVSVVDGEDQTFTITADAGYSISEVLVDGAVITPIPSSYTFSSVIADHSIEATFARPAGIIVGAISGDTAEDGTSATFTVVLNSAPADTVQIPVASTDLSEGTVSPASLSFTPTNWDTPQTITVSGVDDADDDGDQAYTIELAPASSADSDYDGMDPADVNLTNIDDDDAPNNTPNDDDGGGGGGGSGGCFINAAAGGATQSRVCLGLLAMFFPLVFILTSRERLSKP